MPYAPLDHRHIIAITGEDRVGFLQGLITNDATLLSSGKPIYAAMLSPQGKFLHDFFLLPDGERLLLDVDGSRADDLLARLNSYKLRAKVTFRPEENLRVTAIWSEPPAALTGAITITDPRLEALGIRTYGQQDAPSNIASGSYESHRIQLGIPDGAKDMHRDKSLLLEFDFEALHGVSFSKGCYVGQEVTARSKFRGQVRRQLFIVHADTALPPTGTDITSDGTIVGELRSTEGCDGLALLKTDELKNSTAPLMAHGITLSHRIPEWRSVA